MYDFSTILQRLKEVLALQQNKNKIKDKEVALALGLTPEYFAVIKKRGKLPYSAIISYCLKHRININWIFSGYPPIHLDSIDPSKETSYNKSA